MKQFYFLTVFILGCLFAQTLGEGDEAAAAPADAGAGDAVEHFQKGMADAIRKDPENVVPYLNYGAANFDGIQKLMDNYWGNKKMEGDKVHEAGIETQAQASKRKEKMENKQYDYMFKAFKWGEDTMAVGLNPNTAGGTAEDGTDEGGEGHGAEAKKEGGKAPAAGGEGEGEKEAPAEGGEGEPAAVTLGTDAADPEAE